MTNKEQKEMIIANLNAIHSALQMFVNSENSISVLNKSLLATSKAVEQIFFSDKKEPENIVSREALKGYIVDWFEKNRYELKRDGNLYNWSSLINSLFNSIPSENFENMHLGLSLNEPIEAKEIERNLITKIQNYFVEKGYRVTYMPKFAIDSTKNILLEFLNSIK